MTPCELESLKPTFEVPNIVAFEVPAPQEGVMDLEGYTLKAALYPSMFSSDFQLPFCCLVYDVLDYLLLALAQLHLKAWRILVSCCFIKWWDLKKACSKHSDLTTHEFLLTHNLLRKNGNTCNFLSIHALACLEPQYIWVKGWT